MIKVVEAFSGIGAQAKALKNIGANFEIVNTIEWDVNAIIAYDLIHNGKQDLKIYDKYSKVELVDKLSKFTLSVDGKNPIEKNSLNHMTLEKLKRICLAIERTKDLVSITDVKATDLPDDVQLFTYSFPCQDLSICGAWHGNNSGINRDAHNRSGMLWEVERILKEYIELEKKLPSFLLMENVSNILSDTHKHNFEEWKEYLTSIGYVNKVYTLDATNFGIPQSRKRTYMLSVQAKDKKEKNKIEQYFLENDLEKLQFENSKPIQPLETFLRLDYSISKYKEEADMSNPNDTPSRRKIMEDNVILHDGVSTQCGIIKTITTKQDRNPNSGLVIYKNHAKGKSPYRNLTPRECFLLMGFDEEDFQQLMDNNAFVTKGRTLFSREKLIRMAGNSIVVDVLEEIFKQVIDLQENILY